MDAKKVIVLVAIVFIGFWMFTDPGGLAETTKEAAGWIWGLLTDVFVNVIDFVGAMG